MFQHFLHLLRAIFNHMEGVHKEFIIISSYNIHHCICSDLWKSDRLSHRSLDCHHDYCGYVSIVILPRYSAECSFISQYRHGKDTLLPQVPEKPAKPFINFLTDFRVLESL